MIEKVIDFSIRHRWFVLLGVIAIAVLGIYNFQQLPIDAVPDITNIQVQINTSAPGYSPLETEQRITFPIETAMSGIPNLDYTRSISRYGLSQVTVIFKDDTDIYWGRQQIAERLQQAKEQLPPGVSTEMGPISTGLGEIFMWTVDAKEGAKKPDGTAYTPPTCAKSRIGLSNPSSGMYSVWSRSIRSEVLKNNITSPRTPKS